MALAGPNGAGKSTLYHAHIEHQGLGFINAADLAVQLSLDAYEAAQVGNSLREILVAQRESFVFETVFSDPVGDKVGFLRRAAEAGYMVVVCFIGLDSVEMSEERVAMRVSQGGHDVPTEKLAARFERTLANLKRSIEALPVVFVFDSCDLARPFRKVAEFRDSKLVGRNNPLPGWLANIPFAR